MSIFKEAWKILKQNKINLDFHSKNFGDHYKVQGKSGIYISRIYLKVAAWFQQCNCNVGVSNRPWGLCKHGIATIIKRFLDENNLILCEKEEKEN